MTADSLLYLPSILCRAGCLLHSSSRTSGLVLACPWATCARKGRVRAIRNSLIENYLFIFFQAYAFLIQWEKLFQYFIPGFELRGLQQEMVVVELLRQYDRICGLLIFN